MRQINFAEGKWDSKEFRHVYSSRFSSTPLMCQAKECIVNDIDMETGTFAYVSLVTEKKYRTGTRIETTCSFDSYGAPLIVLSNDFYKGDNGKWYFGVHYEIVLYEEGINVWKLNLHKDVMKWDKLLGLKFPVTAKMSHTLSVQVLNNMLDITMEDIHANLWVEDMPSEFRVGITACEGINRFYSCCIEE